VLRAAIALADRGGVAPLSMRRLAQEVPSGAAGWRPAMRDPAMSARAAPLRPPG